MDRRKLVGGISRALPASQFNQVGQYPVFLQSSGTEFSTDKLYYYNGFYGSDNNGDKPKQSAENHINGKVNKFLLWAGKRSLEIYMIHGLLLNIFKSNIVIQFDSIEGCLLTAGNFTLTMVLCAVVIHLLNQNIVLKKVLNIR